MRAETCECCGRDLSDTEICQFCGFDNHKTHWGGWTKKRVRREIARDKMSREVVGKAGEGCLNG